MIRPKRLRATDSKAVISEYLLTVLKKFSQEKITLLIRPFGYPPGRDFVIRQDTISTSIDRETPDLCRDILIEPRPGG